MKPFVFLLIFVMAASAAPEENGDSAAQRLLSANVGVTGAEMLRHAHACEKLATADLPATTRRDLCKRIGDTYYEIDMVRYAAKWNKWYRRAAKLDPAMVHNTPIAVRFTEYAKILLKKNIMRGVYCVYVAVALLFLFRIARSPGAFDALFFLKRLALFLGLFIAGAVIIFAVDGRLFKKSGVAFIRDDTPCACSADTSTHALVKPALSFKCPLIPFSVMELAGSAAIILLVGFLPIALALFYVSFRRPFSSVALVFAIILSVAAFWTHFLMATAFDDLMSSKVAITKSRIIYRGEPEEILLENPEKALRANPDLLKSDNDNFELFIKEHFPQGFPHNGR